MYWTSVYLNKFVSGMNTNILTPKLFRDIFGYFACWISPTEVRLVLLAILNARFDDFFALVGLVCSSFVTISQGTHCRAPWFPLGQESVGFVHTGNELASRCHVQIIFGIRLTGFLGSMVILCPLVSDSNHACPSQVHVATHGNFCLWRNLALGAAIFKSASLASQGQGVVADGTQGASVFKFMYLCVFLCYVDVIHSDLQN